MFEKIPGNPDASMVKSGANFISLSNRYDKYCIRKYLVICFVTIGCSKRLHFHRFTADVLVWTGMHSAHSPIKYNFNLDNIQSYRIYVYRNQVYYQLAEISIINHIRLKSIRIFGETRI